MYQIWNDTYIARCFIACQTPDARLLVRNLSTYLDNKHFDFKVKTNRVTEPTADGRCILEIEAERPFQNQASWVVYLSQVFLPALKKHIEYLMLNHWGSTQTITWLEHRFEIDNACKNTGFNDMQLMDTLPLELRIEEPANAHWFDSPGPIV